MYSTPNALTARRPGKSRGVLSLYGGKTIRAQSYKKGAPEKGAPEENMKNRYYFTKLAGRVNCFRNGQPTLASP